MLFNKAPKLRVLVLSIVDNEGITGFPEGLLICLLGWSTFTFLATPLRCFLPTCLESIKGLYTYTEPGAPNYHGPITNEVKWVNDILYGINPMLTFAHGASSLDGFQPPTAH
jgi:hypothetical protein